MDANNLSSISQENTDEKMGEFWDSHDFTDFDDPNTPDVNFEISCAVPVEVELLAALEKQAHKRGIQVETLVNLWLQQKLDEQKEKTAA
ncbi:MAG: hypothetical protein HS126_12950 [Anaerolineales bacterium]|nr:hypothetical protein [Anaerolineales bacterium]